MSCEFTHRTYAKHSSKHVLGFFEHFFSPFTRRRYVNFSSAKAVKMNNVHSWIEQSEIEENVSKLIKIKIYAKRWIYYLWWYKQDTDVFMKFWNGKVYKYPPPSWYGPSSRFVALSLRHKIFKTSTLIKARSDITFRLMYKKDILTRRWTSPHVEGNSAQINKAASSFLALKLWILLALWLHRF